jgi:hypothetical protein
VLQSFLVQTSTHDLLTRLSIVVLLIAVVLKSWRVDRSAKQCPARAWYRTWQRPKGAVYCLS